MSSAAPGPAPLRPPAPIGAPGPGAGLPVVVHDLAGVERELARLWRAVGAEEARAVVRATSVNLVAVVPEAADRERVAATLAALLGWLPGRVLILAPAELAAGELEAWVTLHCRPMGRGAQVCGEQVAVTAADPQRLGGVVEGLLVPDCPVVLWWRLPAPPAGPLLERLLPGLDGLLLDGARAAVGPLARWVARAGALVVGDLAWEAGRPWREATADAFEPVALRPALAALSAVRVEHGPGGGTAALLYVGWLAARLGWSEGPALGTGAGGAARGRLTAGTAPVDVTLAPVAGEAALATVIVDAARLGLRCAIRRALGGVEARVTDRDGAAPRRRVRCPEPDEAAMVGRWLAAPRQDPIYAAALARAAALASPPPC